MADYSVDIAVAVKGSQQLKKLRTEISNTSRELTTLNKLANKQSKTLPNSFLTLNKVLKQAKLNFDKAAIGTKGYLTSAKQLVEVERRYNRQLVQRKMLLKDLRGTSLIDQIRPNVAASQASRQGSGFRAFSRSFQPPPVDKAAIAIEKSIARNAKKTAKNTQKTAQLLTQQNSSFAFQNIGPGGVGGIGGRLNKLGFGKKADPTGMFAMKGGLGGRIKGAIGSGLIGGGFPLLFGGGGASAAAGGLAGAAGGALAMGGGFAASIAATAIVAQVQEVRAFRKAVRQLDEEMEAMGISSGFSRQRIKELAKELNITKEDAIQLVSQFKDLDAEMGNMLINAFGSRETVETLSGLRTSESVLEKIQSLNSEISRETRNNLLSTLATEGSLQAQLDLEQAIFNKKKQQFADRAIRNFDFDDVFKNKRGNFKAQFRDEQARLDFRVKKTKEFAEEFEKANQQSLEFIEHSIKINEQLQFISEFNAPSEEIRDLINPLRAVLDLSVAIRTGFEESFKGIIKGTMSVKDAFRNMLNRIADYFLDTAARLMAAQIQRGFLGLFSNLFNFSSFVPNSFGTGIPSGSNLLTGSFGTGGVGVGETAKDLTRHLANGGTAQANKSYMVGERGPEIFTPGATGVVTPNHVMGATNIVVNVDASGTNVEGDEDEGRELGRLISVAVQSEIIQQQRPGGLLA